MDFVFARLRYPKLCMGDAMIPHLVGQIADWLNVSRSDSAQLIVVSIGTFVSTLAALIAWRAAVMTSRSVREMAEMRRQQSRPAFLVDGIDKFFLLWDRGEGFVFSLDDERGDEEPFISLKNFGLGPAVEVMFQSVGAPKHFERHDDLSNVRRIFRAGGYKVLRANHGVSIVGAEAGEINNQEFRCYSSQSEFRVEVGPIEIGSVSKIHLPKILLEAFVLKALASTRVEDVNFAWVVRCNLSAKSMSGEVISKYYDLNFFVDRLLFELAEPLQEIDGVPRWSSITVELSLVTHEIRNAPSLSSLISRRISRSLSPVQDRLRKFIAPVSTALRSWIIYGSNPPPKFNVGDRVVWVPAREWALLDDGEIEGFEPVVRDIDASRWNKAEDKPSKSKKSSFVNKGSVQKD